MSSVCNVALLNNISTLSPPRIPCQSPFNPSAWQKFVQDMKTFTSNTELQQVLTQCLCANSLSCSRPDVCPNILSDPMSIFTNPTCANCIFSGPCAKYKLQLKEFLCVLSVFKQNYRADMNPKEQVQFLVTLLNNCCGSHIQISDINVNEAMNVIAVLKGIPMSGSGNNTPNNPSSDSNNDSGTTGWFDKTHTWIVVSVAVVFVIIVLVLIGLWVKRGRLSREVKIASRTSLNLPTKNLETLPPSVVRSSKARSLSKSGIRSRKRT
jgi:hypothetical protein